MLNRLRIGPKLLLAPGVLLLMLVALAVGAYSGMVRQNHSLDDIVEQRAGRIKAASELVIAAQRAHTEVYQLLSWFSASFARARTDALCVQLRRRQADIGRQFASLQGQTGAGGAEQRYVVQAAQAYGRYVAAVQDVIELAPNDASVGTSAMLKAEQAFDVVAQRLDQLARLEQTLSEQAYAGAEADFHRLSLAMPLVVLVAAVLALALSMLVRRALLREVREIGAAANDLASGNLAPRERVYGSDEIGDTARTLDASIGQLNASLATILTAARAIGAASRQVAAGNGDLARRQAMQADTIEQSADAVAELGATARQRASQVQLAGQLGECAALLAAKGSGVVQRLGVTMVAIKGSSARASSLVGAVDELAGQIGALALHAAVEAARAGPPGGAFAQVAAEVRNLSQRATGAAREIKALMAQSAAEIDGGALWVQEAGAGMADIVASVRRMGEIVAAIGHDSSNQAEGLADASGALARVEQMTQNNSAMVRQAAQAAQSLQQQALCLSQAVAGFRLDDAPAPVPPETGAPGRAHLRLASRRA